MVGPEDIVVPVAGMDDQELESVVGDDVLDDDLAEDDLVDDDEDDEDGTRTRTRTTWARSKRKAT